MKIVFFDIHDFEKEYLKKHCLDSLSQVYIKSQLSSCKEINENLKDAEAVSVFVTSRLDSEILKEFKNLKYIFARSVGYNHIDMKYCNENGVKVYITPHYGDWTVAEFTFGLLLNACRKISLGAAAIKTSEVELSEFLGIELHSKTIGIIGYGAIGERVGRIAEGFGMKVVACDDRQTGDCKYVSFEKLLTSSDVITLHCPYSTKTKHLLGKNEFKIMKNGVVIINTARGEIINTKDLIKALESGKVAFAGLDVVECEDLTCNLNNKNFSLDCVNENCLKKYVLNQKLLSLPNVTVTPHIAYSTKEAVERILNLTLQNIENCVKGKTELCLKNQVLV